jgi:predicted acylesterase/phospholipase RssA
MQPTPENNKIRHDDETVTLAKKIIAGQDADYKTMFALAMKLKESQSFGYARRILERIRRYKTEANLPQNRLLLAQQLALATYKDPDLPPDEKLDSALNILQESDDLQTTENQETLGLAGAIHKRRWELDGQKQHLERSLAFYLRGYELGFADDGGYTGINAAFVLDLIANQEEEEAKQANVVMQSAIDRRDKAAEIREKIAKTLGEMAAKDKAKPPAPPDTPLTQQWWFLATIAEALFGLKRYHQAQAWLKEAAQLKNVSEWERESTIRQLALLARLLDKRAGAPGQEQRTSAWEALFESLKVIYGKEREAKIAEHMARAACASAFTGKIGLALSGGGFRAALYHIGVLAKLAEMDVLRKVEALSCVSGGSIVGAHFYLEVRKLLREKTDWEIGKKDYIEIVQRIERDFLAGVQTNIRTRVLVNPLTNLKMIFWPNHSRTLRVGELYEENIYARIKDGEGGKPRWLNDLYIHPKEETGNFQPKIDNWRRESKVPILILNATTLNTGHNWQFTASWMGEPPSSIDSEVDGNYRLRRMYYGDAPEGHKQIRLGHAVAASSCVPGLFEPLALAKLYEGLVVRLVDGGVYDNQGTAGLIDQGCNILLVSDASGQMSSLDNPDNGLLAVPLRTNSVLQARVRVAQYREMAAKRRSSTLRGLMFIHLKKDLQVKPKDWIDCPDPQDSLEPDLPLTKYGISKHAQERLAAIRTDLDSFSDAEAKALMISGYRMTGLELRNCLPELDKSDGKSAEWQFMKFDTDLARVDVPAPMLKLLSVSALLAFKIWKLSRALRVVATALAILLVGLLGWHCWQNWNAPIVTVDFGASDRNLWQFTWGYAAITVLTMVALNRLPAFVRTILRFADYRKTAYEIIVGAGVGILGWIAAGAHLLVFDKLYLRWGSQKHMLGSQERVERVEKVEKVEKE